MENLGYVLIQSLNIPKDLVNIVFMYAHERCFYLKNWDCDYTIQEHIINVAPMNHYEHEIDSMCLNSRYSGYMVYTSNYLSDKELYDYWMYEVNLLTDTNIMSYNMNDHSNSGIYIVNKMILNKRYDRDDIKSYEELNLSVSLWR
jgi:hypothetical protein